MKRYEDLVEAKIIAYTQPVDDITANDLKDFIAYVARVSNPTNQFNNETADGLIRYLIKHLHFSPLEMANVVIEINTTRDIARQILRHRSNVFQEFSQRYADVNELGDFVLREARLQDHDNRQNSVEVDNIELQQQWDSWQSKVIQTATEAYEWAIENHLAKEVARVVLPEGLTPSRMYVNGNIRNWIHYLGVREGKPTGTQKEHRLVADAVKMEILKIFNFQLTNDQ